MAFAPAGQPVATASWDGTVQVWSLCGELLADLDEGVPVNSVAFSGGGGGSLAATGLQDGTIGVLEWATGREQARLEGDDHSRKLTSVWFSPGSFTVRRAWKARLPPVQQ